VELAAKAGSEPDDVALDFGEPVGVAFQAAAKLLQRPRRFGVIGFGRLAFPRGWAHEIGEALQVTADPTQPPPLDFESPNQLRHVGPQRGFYTSKGLRQNVGGLLLN